MKKHEVRERILGIGIIPVVRADSPDHAIEVARKIFEGGIPIVELTLTVPGAVEVIAELARSTKDVLIGAGTVLDEYHARRCIEAGAEFIVSPGFDSPTVEFAKDNSILMMAGAMTPTEVMHAWKHGCDFVKIFPCGNVGGPSYIKALKTVLPHIRMVPTGGVNLSNAEAYLRAGAEAIGVGSELTSAPSIGEAARQFLAAVQAARNA